jgi:hypothetical protein
MLRRRFKQILSLEERLSEEAKRLREEAKLLPPGPERDVLIRRARQAETGSRMSEWLRSPKLQPPKCTMQDYRVFVLGPDGHVTSRVDLWCTDEADAKERAKQLVDRHDVELWHRDQRIAIFHHEKQ